MANDVDMWELSKICLEMAYVIDKQIKYVGNDLKIWEMANIFCEIA